MSALTGKGLFLIMHVAPNIRMLTLALLTSAAPMTALHAQEAAPSPTASDEGDTIIVLGRGPGPCRPARRLTARSRSDRGTLVETSSGMVENALANVAAACSSSADRTAARPMRPRRA